MKERLLLLSEVAEITQQHVKSVTKAIKEGRLPSIRVGKRYRIPESSLHDWIRSNTRNVDVITQDPSAAS